MDKIDLWLRKSQGTMMSTKHPSLLGRLLLTLLLIMIPFLATAEDWPTYLHDAQRTAASGSETALSPANAGQLKLLWTFKTGGVVAASATIANDVVYVGSWDGYEYALDAATGALKWKTYLGTTSAANCNPPAAGITSAATVQNGTLYVGGGDAYWYALDTTTGNILWKVYTGDNSAAGGHYNWSSPLIYGNHAYVGVASFGDCPLVQGQLLQVDLTTHQVVNTFDVVPNGQIGGGIWTSPAIDPATSTIYVTTGTEGVDPYSTQPYSLAMLAIDASALAVKGSWQIPPQQAVTDSDWGVTPVLLNDATGASLVAATNKDGYLYAFDRSNIGTGPVWQRQIARGGAYPQGGDGSVASGAFGQGRLYVAGGATTINATTPVSGSVRALDPSTGNYLWEHGTAKPVIAALAYANGLVIDGAGPMLEVLDASSGAVLYSYVTPGTFYGAPSVSNGRIFAGSTDGNVYAFGPTSGATAAVKINLQASFNNAGISDDTNTTAANFDTYGNSYSSQALQAAGVSAGQTVTYNGVPFQWPSSPSGAIDNTIAQTQTITLGASGPGTSLALLGSESGGVANGTASVSYSDGTTQQVSLTLSDWTLNGGTKPPEIGNTTVITTTYRNASYGRDTANPAYVFYTAIPLESTKTPVSLTLPPLAYPRLHVFAMTLVSIAPASITATPTPTATSIPTNAPTGTPTMTAIPPSATSTPTSTSTGAPPGTASATGTPTATATATTTAFSSTSTATSTVTPAPLAASGTPTSTTIATPVPPTATTPASTCPTGWSCSDIGAPALAGSQHLSGSTWAISGAGADIGGTADQFHFVWQSFSGDGGISARVVSQTTGQPWAKAGIILRQSSSAGSPGYGVFVTPGKGVLVQYRITQGGKTVVVSSTAGLMPIYLRISRSGSSFAAYTSQDGQTWTAVAGSNVMLNLGNTLLRGLAVTSHSSSSLNTATFDTVTLL